MVDSPARIICKVCDELNTFDNESPKGVFSYSPCQGCEFPLLYRNTNPNNHALNRRTFEKYAEAVSAWGLEIQEENKALRAELKVLKANRRESQGFDKLPVVSDHLNQHVIDTAVLESLLSESQHINQLEQYIQDIGDRLNTIEKGTSTSNARSLNNIQQVRSLAQHLQSIEARFSKFETAQSDISSNNEKKTAGSELHPSKQFVDRADESYAGFIPSTEQQRTQDSVNVYNKRSAEEFVRRVSAERAGATARTMDIARLGQVKEAVFKTGNGNYWLFVSDDPNVAYLVPHRRALRLNHNTVDILRICFELTHDSSLWSLNVNEQNANMDKAELVYPAVLDVFSDDRTLWKIRKKGVLLFP